MSADIFRREGESITDCIQRLMIEPLVGPRVPDTELARIANCQPAQARSARREWMLLEYAQTIAADVGWAGEIPDLIRDALTEYALASCELERCTHESCAAVYAMRQGQSKKAIFMTELSHRHGFIAVLASEGISLKLVDGDRFVSTPRAIPDEIRDWIVMHRKAIVAELKSAETNADVA